jgi:ribosomal-protein-alanine N-acetyltransferase
VDQQRAGHGIAPTAVALATDHCFGTLGLHRMEINIRPENAASLRVVEKLGFRDEGYRPRFLHINGVWADHRTFALTSEEVPEGLLSRWLKTRSS